MPERKIDLPLSFDNSLSVKEIRCDGENLFVSSSLESFFVHLNARSVRMLHAFLVSFPTSFVVSLNWDYSDVEIYKKLVEESTQQYLPLDVFMPRPPVNFPLGAIGPEWMKGRTVKQIDEISKESSETGKSLEEVSSQDKYKSN